MLKNIHILCAGITFFLFLIRGIWMIKKSPLRQQTWLKVMPPVIDTILLASGITMMVQIQQYPGQDGWLTVKVAAVILYIVLGTIGLNRGKTRHIRIAAWSASLIVFAYIVAIALTRTPVLFS